MRIAVFPGSFDPITLGHFDIVERAAPLFDKIIIAIGQNSQKKYMFSLEQRIEFIKKTFEKFPNVEVDHFEGLTIDYCRSKNVNFILRGLRNPADFEFEKAIAQTNRELTQSNKVETIFLLTSASKSFISSSIVREIITFGGNYELLVPDTVRVNVGKK
ncbi:Phosphopantetheine adenylyltransferase [Flavobacteriaceae bacterium 3519-10]|nr:Phosphopantetheine adenylyltransferase [Flavobacteriaceae bacterium 3519-10]